MAKQSAPKTEADKVPKRLNRAVGVAEAMGGLLDPVMKKRGFASRDIINQWSAIAPPPYDKVTLPEKLTWPRGERSAEGATLYLMCEPGRGLAIAHEGPNIARAVNRYFGYVLVGQVRLSPTPFSRHSDAEAQKKVVLSEGDRQRVDKALADVADPGLRAALQRLGQGILGKAKSGGQKR